MNGTSNLPQRFYSLDVLRGLGALTIVFNHWNNFFYYDKHPPGLEALPLAGVLRPLYDEGWRAVDMFFCLSGFVFFWLYSEKIRSGVTSLGEFSVLRFSRLYPLHLATLLIAALGQWLLFRAYGSYLENTANDIGHFIAQLFFVSGWGMRDSFNTPAWSVSVEIFLYFVFFVLCRCRCIRVWQLLVYAGIGEFWCIHHGNFLLLARGVLSFFMGGLAFRAYDFSRPLAASKWLMLWLGAALVLLWVLVPLEVNHNYSCALYQMAFGNPDSGIRHLIGRYLWWLSTGLYALALFPCTLWFLALWETRRGTLGRRAAILGDISYSTYLIHFPLQMLFLLVAGWAGFSSSIWRSPLAMLIFFSVLIPVSVCSHNYFERPLQSFLRKRLGRRSLTSFFGFFPVSSGISRP